MNSNHYAGVGQINVLITDSKADKKEVKHLKDLGMKVLIGNR